MHSLPTPLTTLPACAGIGLRAPHHRQVLASPPNVGWLEVHSENFFGPGGEPLRVLEAVRARYPISLHGVGMSLGSADELSRPHLRKLKTLVERIEPASISEHLCWSSIGEHYLNDLLPLPYTRAALDHVCARIGRVQDFLGRQLLIENVSSYLRFAGAEMTEWDFVVEVSRRSGCGILLDVNNIYVNARNHGFDAAAYLEAIPVPVVKEIHLAGYEDTGDCLIDTHGHRVFPAVWDLYALAVQRFGRVPALIEWDTDIPALSVLMEEAAKAQTVLEAPHVRVA